MNIVISTGAGISAESGIATYRDAGGLWTKYDPQVVSHIRGWRTQPQLVLNFKNELRKEFEAGRFEPNPAHLALARLQCEWTSGSVTVITQNIDGLHEKAGTKVLAMHGTAATKFCEVCGFESPYDADIVLAHACKKCGRKERTRPSVVMFGEIPRHMEEIQARLQDCDILMVVGSSLEVSPGNQFAHWVRKNKRDATTIVVNRDRLDDELTRDYHHQVVGPASVEVPRLVEEMLSAQEARAQEGPWMALRRRWAGR